ncbi:MAG: nucleolar RNA-binding Nop10p family protein [Candidatus Woesearchaeota archaeon]
MKRILKCTECGSYGLSINCSCGGMRIECNPPKVTLEDKYGHYRRKAKELKL